MFLNFRNTFYISLVITSILLFGGISKGNSFALADAPANTDSIPNVFTPNGDGVNDVFEIKGLDESQKYNLKIFNRWGQLVFETDYPSGHFWDGRTSSGIAVPSGVYFYILEGENSASKGFVNLLK